MKEKVVLTYSKGITHSPSDLICGDGELEECVNLEVKNGELVPMEMPVKLGVSLAEGEKLLLVHDTKSGDKNYVTYLNGSIHFREASTGNLHECSVEAGEITTIQSIGNTIIAYDSEKPHYILFSESVYKYLGSNMPDLGMSFSLEGEVVVSETEDINVPSTGDKNEPDLSNDDNKDKVTSQIIALVNKFIAEESEEKGKFIFPFLVRYAYQLYDGSYIKQSSPVLMMPSTTIAPLCGYLARQDKRPPFKTFVAAVPSSLKFYNDDFDVAKKLKDWSDIISNVSIFVSSPIRTYDQEGDVTGVSFDTTSNIYNQSLFYGSLKGAATLEQAKYTISEHFALADNNPSSFVFWNLPQKGFDDIRTEILGCSLFYKYASLSIEDINSNSKIINPSEVGVNPVSGIELQEVLPDDYMTHDTLLPNSTFVYNGRLNLSGIKRVLFKGYSAMSLTQVGFSGSMLGLYYVYTYIRTSNGTIVVKSPLGNRSIDMYGAYLFYPDTDAYRMIIHDTTNNRYADVSLAPHSGLNGAVYFGDFNELAFRAGTPLVEETYANYEELRNKLYVSAVNNPFYFPLEGIYTVGTDRIIGMGAITRPISQGQFGEFPLIVFCSDGNYAMRVDEQGFYAAISPVQEDVVLGSDKITAMENSLVVITKKGLMLTTGGEMQKLAVQMDGGVVNSIMFEGIGTSVSNLSTLVNKARDKAGFLSYVYNAKMAFDYASNRLLVYNPNKTYSYLYNLDNDTATKLVINGGKKIVASALDYPDTIVQDESGALYSLYTKEDVSSKDSRQYGMALTRPLKLGAALNMKSIRQIIHLTSNCGSGSYVKYILYGSNDNATYYRVSSRFGKPYKYYRVAIYTYLLPKESLSGSALTMEERRTHKLR
jgi:hypothetical protein